MSVSDHNRYDPDRPYYPGDPPQPWRWMQHRLYKQGINSSPDEAQKLFALQIVHDIKLSFQQELARQGINVSPEEAYNLSKQKQEHDIKRDMQQDLAKQGVDVSPDEADAIHKQRIIHLMMERIGTTDPREAIERMASEAMEHAGTTDPHEAIKRIALEAIESMMFYDTPKPYEPNE